MASTIQMGSPEVSVPVHASHLFCTPTANFVVSTRREGHVDVYLYNEKLVCTFKGNLNRISFIVHLVGETVASVDRSGRLFLPEKSWELWTFRLKPVEAGFGI